MADNFEREPITARQQQVLTFAKSIDKQGTRLSS